MSGMHTIHTEHGDTYRIGRDDHCLVVAEGSNGTRKVHLSRDMLRWLAQHGIERLDAMRAPSPQPRSLTGPHKENTMDPVERCTTVGGCGSAIEQPAGEGHIVIGGHVTQTAVTQNAYELLDTVKRIAVRVGEVHAKLFVPTPIPTDAPEGEAPKQPHEAIAHAVDGSLVVARQIESDLTELHKRL